MQPSTPDAPLASVTVVVAARNAATTLDRAVRSALVSNDVVQCVVVDDASDDDTGGVARRLAARDDRVELVTRATRGGPCVARNEGLSVARGSGVCFLDADDQLVDGGLEQLSRSLAATRGAVVALGRFTAVAPSGEAVDVGTWATVQLQPVVRRHGTMVPSQHGIEPEALVSRLISPPPGAWLVDAACARALGGFDPDARRSEDLEFLVRLAAAGPVTTVDDDVLLYTRHDAQRSAATTRRRWGRVHALWLMVRAAPGPDASRTLARGMRAYHLELFEQRRHASSARERAASLRNLAAAAGLSVLGAVGSVLPRHSLSPIASGESGAVD